MCLSLLVFLQECIQVDMRAVLGAADHVPTKSCKPLFPDIGVTFHNNSSLLGLPVVQTLVPVR